MVLRRGNEMVTLTNKIQIAAYINSGFEEVKEIPKKGGKTNGAGKTSGGAQEN